MMPKGWRKSGSRTPAILAMAADGRSIMEIAKHVGCSSANVVQTLKRYSVWNGRVDPLPAEMTGWLNAEADKSGVPASTMARAMLMDAINDAMEKNA